MDKLICDGCNVNAPFEHRCHTNGRPGRIMVRGMAHEGTMCACSECCPPLRIAYNNGTFVDDREVYPTGVEYRFTPRPGWYMHAFCLREQARRSFPVSAITVLDRE